MAIISDGTTNHKKAANTASRPSPKKAIETGLSKPVPLAVIEQNIPPEMIAKRQWVAWQYRQRNGRWTKPPINPRTGANASSTDPETWEDFPAAVAYYKGGHADGIGYVVNGPGIVGIDLDDARDPATGELTEDAARIVREFSAYSEVSPTGTGLRIFCRGTMPEDGRKVGNVEFFQAGKYLTVTGHRLPGCPDSLEERQNQLTALYDRIFAGKNDKGHKSNGQASHDLFNGGLTDAEIIEKASTAVNGSKFNALWSGDTSAYGGDHSAADLALCSLLAFFTGPDQARIDSLFRRFGLFREKWNRQDYRERTINKALDGMTEFYTVKPGKGSPRHTADPLDQAKINLTDRGNALRLVKEYGDQLRHCWPWGKWLVWDGKRRRIDDSGAVVRLSKVTIAKLFGWATSKIQEIQKTLEASAR